MKRSVCPSSYELFSELEGVSLELSHRLRLDAAGIPVSNKWSLLTNAAQLNHAGAQRALAAEKARLEALERDQENARRAAEIFDPWWGETLVQGLVGLTRREEEIGSWRA